VICVVTGPPGAGKTLYTVQKIAEAILAGKYVATNVLLADDWAERIADTTVLRFQKRRRAAKCAEWRRRMVYVETLGELARVRLSTEGFERGKLEGRGVAVFDEAGEALDSRAWNEDKERRRADNRFMRQHRKLGWDVYLVAQEEEQLDARVRGMAEYLIRLRNLKREPRVLGVSLGAILPRPVILALWAWHGVKSARPARKEVFTLRKRIAGMYDTHQLVGGEGEDAADVLWLPLASDGGAGRPDAGGRPAPPASAGAATMPAPAPPVVVAGIEVGPSLVPLPPEFVASAGAAVDDRQGLIAVERHESPAVTGALGEPTAPPSPRSAPVELSDAMDTLRPVPLDAEPLVNAERGPLAPAPVPDAPGAASPNGRRQP
jgi:hypothetical protein